MCLRSFPQKPFPSFKTRVLKGICFLTFYYTIICLLVLNFTTKIFLSKFPSVFSFLKENGARRPVGVLFLFTRDPGQLLLLPSLLWPLVPRPPHGEEDDFGEAG